MKYRVINITDMNLYRVLIQYALRKSTHISICTFSYYHKKDLTEKYGEFLGALAPFAETSIEQFDLPRKYTKGQKYHVYSLTSSVKKAVNSVARLQEWRAPNYPEDLSFYDGCHCWLSTISHEGIAYLKSNDAQLISDVIEMGAELLQV